MVADNSILPHLLTLVIREAVMTYQISDPDILAGEIIDNIEAGLASFREIVDITGRDAEAEST